MVKIYPDIQNRLKLGVWNSSKLVLKYYSRISVETMDIFHINVNFNPLPCSFKVKSWMFFVHPITKSTINGYIVDFTCSPLLASVAPGFHLFSSLSYRPAVMRWSVSVTETTQGRTAVSLIPSLSLQSRQAQRRKVHSRSDATYVSLSVCLSYPPHSLYHHHCIFSTCWSSNILSSNANSSSPDYCEKVNIDV